MKKTTLKLLIVMLCLANYFFAQSQTNDSSVDVIPHWKKDETHSVKIKTTTTDLNADNGKSQTYVSTFNAKFKVLDVSDSGYKVEWVYASSNLAGNEPVLESQIIGKLINVPMIIKLSDVGRFVELVNADDVQIAANKAVDDLIANSTSNHAMNISYKGAKQLISSKKALEVVILKQIKIYNFSFGFNYKLNYVQTNNLKFPNPFGGQAFDAVEKVQLTKLDKTNSICVIETNKTINGNTVKAAVTEYVKKVSQADPKTIDEQLGKANLEISESSMQQLDFSKGLVEESSYKRIMNLGVQNRTTILEIETTD